MAKLAPWALLALLPLAACNTNSSSPFGQTVPQPVPATVFAQDQSYALQAANSDMFEIQSSQMALQKSRSPAIRRFAQRMIDDHTTTSQTLQTIAGQKGIALPTELDPPTMQKMSVLSAANRTFDREYLAAQVSGHRDALQNAQVESSSGQDPDLKMAAQQTAPMIQDHLNMAQRLRAR